MKESDLNKKAQDLIELNAGYCFKTIVTNKSGVHDVIACINGRFCSLEGKLEYNKMSELQRQHKAMVIAAGGLSTEVKSLDDVKRIIEWAHKGYIQPLEEAGLIEFQL